MALLLWEPDESSDQGRFTLQLHSGCDERDLPLSLSFCMRREGLRATPEESEGWVRSRIVPENRHNIAEVLLANGLTRYDEVRLLAACGGRSSDDDYRAFEIQLGESQLRGLVADDEDGDVAHPLLADRVIASLERRWNGAEVRYAFVGMPGGADGSTGLESNVTAARCIGNQIRALRLDAGLTQKQLAARAGITQTVLSRTESGKGNPTLSLLQDIARALGKQLDVRMTASP